MNFNPDIGHHKYVKYIGHYKYVNITYRKCSVYYYSRVSNECLFLVYSKGGSYCLQILGF